MDNERTYRTSDFMLATYLYSKGIILQDIVPLPDDHYRKNFIFNYPPEKLLSEFQTGEAQVKLTAYHHAVNTLRAMLRISGR